MLFITIFYTQESRDRILREPKKCIREDAWLGEAYYFWYDLFDADLWGNSTKKRTSYYEVYQGTIEIDNILDTVFNEDHYTFWLGQVEKVSKILLKKTKIKPTLKEVNDFFKEKGVWKDVDGIQFQDLPINPDHLLIKPLEYKNKKVIFAYRKRIQLAVYNSEIITNFALLKREECLNT
jgi:hypothetical protein